MNFGCAELHPKMKRGTVMGTIIIFLLLAWLAAPIVLGVILFVTLSDNKRLKEENKKLMLRFGELSGSAPPPPAPSPPAAAPNAQPAPQTVMRPDWSAFKEDEQPQHVAAEQQPPVRSVAVNPEKQGISTINIMLIIGALLIIIAGLIFATTTWDVLSNGARAAVIFSFSAVFFAASSLCERKLHLKKTGILFYTLGSFFLPITLLAAGYFSVFGSWFSLYGKGSSLLLASTFASLAAVTLKGSEDYKSKAFAWCSMLSTSAAVCFLAFQLDKSFDVVSLLLAVYSLAAILLCGWLSGLKSERFSTIISQMRLFSVLNTSALSISAIVCCMNSGRNTVMSLFSCVIFAAAFLHGSFSGKNSFGGALPFTAFITAGLLSLISPDGFNSFTYVLVAVTLILSVFSLMGIVPVGLKGAFRYISSAFQIITLILCIGSVMFTAEATWASFAAYSLLAADILLLAKLGKGKEKSDGQPQNSDASDEPARKSHAADSENRVMLAAFSAACVILARLLSFLLFEGADMAVIGCSCTIMLLILQAVFVLASPLRLRTAASDIIFSVAAGISMLAVFFSSRGLFSEITSLQAVCMTLSCAAAVLTLLAPVICKNGRKFTTAYTTTAGIISSLMAVPITRLVLGLIFVSSSGLPEEAVLSRYITLECAATLIGTSVWLLVMAVVSVLAMLTVCKKDGCTELARKIDTALITAFRTVLVIYFFSNFSDLKRMSLLSERTIFGLVSAFPLLLLFAVSALRSAKLRSKSEHITALLSLTAFVMSASMRFLDDDLHFCWIIVVTAAAVAVLYGINELVRRFGKTPPQFYTLTMYTTSCTLALLTALAMTVYMPEDVSSLYLIPMAVMFGLSAFANYRSRFTVILLPQFIMLYVVLAKHADLASSTDTIAIMFLIATVVSIGLSYLLHRERLIDKMGYIDVMAFTRFWSLVMVYECMDLDGAWIIYPILSASFASMCRTAYKQSSNRVMLTLASLTLVGAWIRQPFISIPELIETELNIAAVLLFFFSLRYIWRDKLKTVDFITYIAYCIAFAVLFFGAIGTGELTDGLILVISAFALLVYSFLVRRRKWFLLSVIVIVVSTVLMSGSFRESAAWWVFLIVAGLVLIAIGIVNEITKQSGEGKSEFSRKLSRFMSEWTW